MKVTFLAVVFRFVKSIWNC